MNIWVRRQVSVLRKGFHNASRWMRRRIAVWREIFHNASYIDQLFMVTGLLFTLSLPMFLFIPISRMGEIILWTFFGTWAVDYLWRNRWPALENGVVSYAEECGWDIVISVEKVP